MAEKNPNDQATPLSERELEILRLVADGLSNKEIASRLFLSVNTVKVHVRNIFGKIGVQSRTEASMYAVAQGWVSLPETGGGAEVFSQPLLSTGVSASPAHLHAAPEVESVPERPLAVDEGEEDLDGPAYAGDALEGLLSVAELADRSDADSGATESLLLPWPKRLALVFIVLLALAGVAVTWPGSAPAGATQLGGLVELRGDGKTLKNTTEDAAWQELAPMSAPRGRLALAVAGEQLYAIGGFTSAGVDSSVEVYDPRSDAWRMAAKKPTPAGNVAAVALNGRIYVPGGCDAAGLPTDGVEVYDVQMDEWSSDAAPLPVAVCAYALALYEQDLYLFGGSDGQSYGANAYRYDPAADRWSELPPMPTARGFAAAAGLGRAIYVVGGYDGQRDLGVCERYWPAENRWEACAPLAVGRGGLGMVAVAGRLYAFGGGWDGYLAFSEQYNPDSDAWSTLDTPLVGQWRNLAVAAVDSDVYAVGGWDGQAYLSVNMTFNPLPFKIFLPIQSGGSEDDPSSD